MGRGRKKRRQESLWVATEELPRTKKHVFYDRVNRILEADGFDRFAESVCEKFYARRGRPSVAPGVYFRMLLVGYFEGLTSERGIAWRCADSLSLRGFLGVGLTTNVLNGSCSPAIDGSSNASANCPAVQARDRRCGLQSYRPCAYGRSRLNRTAIEGLR